MKQVIFLIVFLCNSLIGVAQVSSEAFGDQVFKFIADGDNQMLQGLFENAIMSYDNAIAQNPASAEALIKRAIAKYRTGREVEAKQDMQTANTINPYVGDLHGFGGGIRRLHILAFEPMKLIAQPKMDYILDDYKQIWKTDLIDLDFVEINIENVNETIERVLITQVIEWIETGELENAERILLAKNKLQPIHYDLLGIIKKQNLQWEMAYQYFEKAIMLDPKNAPSYYFMSIIKTHDKEYQKAIELVDKAIFHNPKMLKARFHKAILYKMLEEPKQALKAYDFLEDKAQLAYEVHVNLAITKKLMGEPNQAMFHINQAINLQEGNENPNLYKLKGNIYMLINDYEQSIRDYNKAIQLNSNFAEAYFNLAMVQIIQHNRIVACHNLEKSINLGYLQAREKVKYFCTF